MNMERSYEPLEEHDLEELKKLALKEHEDFFIRNPHLKSAYYNSLIGICLCQGAALHLLKRKVGIKDFDIWHFYEKHDSTSFPNRAHKRIENGYKSKPIDFLKRAILKDICNSYPNNPEQIIMKYLCKENTNTKVHLLKKAIVGLYPDEIFNKVLHNGKHDIWPSPNTA